MSLLGNIFKKKKPELSPIDLAPLVTDLHSHLIPGIDDGAKSVEDSIKLIKGLMDHGYQKIITTPHVMSDYYRNTPETILGGLEKVKKALKEENIAIEIQASAEYYLDADFELKIDSKELLPFGDKNYILFELPFVGEPKNLDAVIFKLITSGYQPILAHPERYSYWHNNINRMRAITEQGCLLQVNLNSFTGFYNLAVKNTAETLAKADLISFVGSDCHHNGHIQLINDARKNESLHYLINENKLLNNTL